MADREIRVVSSRLPPLHIRDVDILDEESEHVLALCYYCHDAYVPVPISEYYRFVVYNCGCHKEPMDSDVKFLLWIVGILLVITLIGMFWRYGIGLYL